ncbi:MAG: hypothetical protein ABR575_11280 [Actinomycetota bacterium]
MMADSGPGGETANARDLDTSYEDKVERLARKLLYGGDGNQEGANDIETARRQARRMLEESEARTQQATGLHPEDDGVIRRSSSETASSGDTGGTRRVSEGE